MAFGVAAVAAPVAKSYELTSEYLEDRSRPSLTHSYQGVWTDEKWDSLADGHDQFQILCICRSSPRAPLPVVDGVLELGGCVAAQRARRGRICYVQVLAQARGFAVRQSLAPVRCTPQNS